MTKISSDNLYYYDKEVVKSISEKYGIPYMEAFIIFINSLTYKMLEDKKYEMYEFGALVIFDMWENEIVTGTPQNSVYLRSE